jgi:hypothetical protein
MNFIEAIEKLKNSALRTGNRTNKLMRKAEGFQVGSTNYNELISNNYRLQEWGAYKPTVDDILAQDWYLIKDEKLHTFEEALAAYKSGYNIRRKDIVYALDSDCSFTKDDVIANDWIIIDKEGVK